MKKRIITLISVAALGITLASCNYVDIRSRKLVSISLQDTTTAYTVGQKYIDRCNLSIVGTYFDSSTETFSKADVSYYLKCNNTTYDVNSPFTVAGNYYLTVQRNGVNSNTIEIKVLANEQYVSNITVNGSNEVEQSKYLSLDLVISPSIFTVDITCENSTPNRVEVNKINNTSYRIRGLELGSASITFKAKNSATTYLSVPYSIEVIPSSKTEIEQTYNDYIKHSALGISSCPLSGNVNLLVIPVWFTDSNSYINSSHKEYVREDIQKVYFGNDTGWESVSSFYKKESNGELTLSGTVSEWYSCNLSSTTVATYDTDEDATPQENLVKNATNWYFTNHASDSRSNYDSDNDTYLDGVMLIYGAPDYRAYSGYSGTNMWAYCYWVTSDTHTASRPGVCAYFWASYDFMYSQDKAIARTGNGYNSGDTTHLSAENPVDAHTYIHEMGHVFGLEDYYDYASTTSPAAGFSMQDNNVGGHDPFSVMAFGWADPKIPTDSGTIWINDFQSSHDLILLSNNWNSTYNSPFDEYILLELYSNTGLNKLDSDYKYHYNYAQGPQAVGLRVWHVDARLLQLDNYYGTTAHFASTTDVKNTNRLLPAFTNTSSSSVRESYAHYYLHQADYQKMNLLQLIRNSTSKSYNDNSDLSESDLFKKGSSFSMSTFNKQFVKGTKLDNGTDLGWSFNVLDIISNSDGSHSAEIQLVKA